MGLGGYLTWTAAMREISEHNLDDDTKILPCEVNGAVITKIVKSPVFENNPYIYDEAKDKGKNIFVLPLNLQETNYCKKDTPDKAYQRYDKHIIEQIVEYYGIKNPTLKCELYFKESEKLQVDQILKDNSIGSEFIVIEPQTKDSYTKNKKYPLAKWQYVVDQLLKDGHTIVQLGQETKKKNLKGVINLTGKTTFRHAARILEKSKLLIASEGGLMHAANAVSTISVIVYTGFIHPDMTAYPENTNIWIGEKHGPCGMKIECKECSLDAKNHNPIEIVNAARDLLS